MTARTPPPQIGSGSAGSGPVVSGLDALSLYKAYLDDLGRIGGRHETLRQFYISLVSALFVFFSLVGKDGPLVDLRESVLKLIAGVGLAICLLWLLHMWRFANLFTSKLSTLRTLEKEANFPIKPFTREEELDDQRRASWSKVRKWFARRLRLTTVDRLLPFVFAALFLMLLRAKIGS